MSSPAEPGLAPATVSHGPRRRGWSLQQKAWLLTTGVLVLLAGLLGLGVDAVFRRASAELEARWVADCVRRTQAAATAEVDTLVRSARDYSMWTDTYEYVVDGNEAYVTNNLLPSMFTNLQLDAFLIYDAAGRLRLARGYDGRAVTDLAGSRVAAALARFAPPAVAALGKAPPSGMVEVDGQLVMFAMLSILHDDGSGPPRGALAHVRYLSPERVQKLRDVVNLNLALRIPAPPEWSGGTPPGAQPFLAAPIDEASLRAVAPLQDADGRVVGAWELTLPREIHQHGVRTRTTFYGVLSVLILAAAVLIGWLLRSMVIARLEALHGAVERVESTGDLSVRLPVRGADELARLTDGLNRMLAALEQGETVRLAAERERERLNAQLQEAQKMEAIGTLAGGLAHDFNNLLMSIQGAAAMLRADCPPAAALERNLSRIERASEQAARLVKQMVAFSRRGPTSFRTVSLSHVVREAVGLVRASLPRQITIEVHNLAQHDLVQADSSQLQQVLMNLATNASHAMAGAGGKLTISLTEVQLPDPAWPEPIRLPAGDYLRLSVADTGCGIAPEHLGRVFEPFYTTKPVGSGTGLGLAVAHGIVTGHAGAIGIESKVGVGTTVHIHLPRARTTAADPEDDRPDAARPGVANRSVRLLLVDDDVLVRETLEAGARRLGYRVISAAGAAEALRLFESDPGAFDVVITDQLMPGWTGLELGDRLRRVRSNVPLILITGYAAALDERTVKASGFAAMLMKPVTIEAVDRAIQVACGQVA